MLSLKQFNIHYSNSEDRGANGNSTNCEDERSYDQLGKGYSPKYRKAFPFLCWFCI